MFSSPISSAVALDLNQIIQALTPVFACVCNGLTTDEKKEEDELRQKRYVRRKLKECEVREECDERIWWS